MIFTHNASRAFRRGLVNGFTATARATSSLPRYSYRPSSTDADAWREVGKLLNEAYQEVGTEVVKTTCKNSIRHQNQPA